jgi:hypothetical protein
MLLRLASRTDRQGNAWVMDKIELAQLIARVRRAMPRNGDVMALCDVLERRMVGNVTSPPSNVTSGARNVTDCPRCAQQKEAARARVARHRAGREV